MVQISGENSELFLSVCPEREWQKYARRSPALSKDKGLKDIGHNMTIEI